MSRGRGRPHARAMGDGLASADLLPEEEVDEDLADDVLDAAVTDAGGRASRGRWQHRRGRPCDWRRRAPAHRSCGGCFRRFVRRSWFYAGQVTMTPSCSSPRYSTALGVSCVSMLRRFVFAPVIDRGERHARSASVRLRALGPGWPPPGTPGLALPPLLLNTRAKNLYDLKSRRGKPIIIRHPSPKSPMI